MIYYLRHIQRIEEEELSELMAFLSPERRERISRFRFPKDRVQSALAFLLFRYGLIKEYGIFHMPDIGRMDTGKPYLRDYASIHFNISHCEHGVSCGFSHRPIGVDIQHLIPYKDSLARYFMTEEEHDFILNREDGRGFVQLWTLKESYGKCQGFGIRYPMNKTLLIHGKSPEDHVMKSWWRDRLCISVCGWEEQELHEVSFSQLKTFYSNYRSEEDLSNDNGK